MRSQPKAQHIGVRTQATACHRSWLCWTFTALLIAILSCGARANVLDEAKLGILCYSILNHAQREAGTDLNAEVLFSAPGWFLDDRRSHGLKVLLKPRAAIGASVNTIGKTSMVNVGMHWQAALHSDLVGPQDGHSATFSFGASVQDGKLGNTGPGWSALGSRVLFHLSAELGYPFGEHYNLSVYFEHASNGGIARWNTSLNNGCAKAADYRAINLSETRLVAVAQGTTNAY